MTRRTRTKIAVLLKILLGVLLCSPILLAFIFSFQSNGDIMKVPVKLITDNPTLENYVYVFKNLNIFAYLKNTLIDCVLCLGSIVIVSSATAYVFVFLEFRLKNLLFQIFLLTMMIPSEVVIITNFFTVQKLDLLDTYLGVAITHMVTVGSIFMLRQFYRTLPKELLEAAKLDGCGEVGLYRHVALPLSVPTLTAIVISGFITVYNRYFWPLLVINEETRSTIQLAVAQLTTTDRSEYGYVLATSFVAMVPTIIIFISLQKYFIRGMVAGSVK